MTKARDGETTLWAVVLSAAALVVGLALFQERRQPPASAGSAVPALSLPALRGGSPVPLPLGKVTLVDFWATWCAPCRASMPRVQRLWREYAPRGLALYSVNTDEESASRTSQVAEFLLQNQLEFPVVLEGADRPASQAFRVAALPTLVVLDRAGKVVWSRIGALSAGEERDLRGALDAALRNPSAPN